MEGAVASVIGRVVELLFTRITKELGYWFCSGSKVNAMNEKKTQLNVAAKNIENVKDHNPGRVLPSDVSTWLEEVEKIKIEAERIPTNGIGIGCFNIAKRYKAGKDSSVILKNIDARLNNIPQLVPIGEKALSKVDTKNHASTSSAPVDDSNTGYSFKTRDVIFKKALECLEPKNSKTQKIALCGMGGVGKTHMMELLKKAVEDFRMFYWIVKVAVGQNTDLIALQNAVAEQTGGALKETLIDLRANRLMKRFTDMSNDGEKKILVILDDLWENVNLQHLGLTSPLPNSFKLLITSRKADVCANMEVETDSVFNIGPLNDAEARKLFFDTSELSKDNEPNLSSIGEEITKLCGNLPIALKVIGSTLRGKANKEGACRVALYHLQHHEIKDHYDIVHKAFEISYNDLKLAAKELFLLSGLFPDDFDIPVEALIRYRWGLKLFSEGFSFAQARLRVEICIEDLINANLLAISDRVGCVKMHDLARAFALSDSIEVKQASIVNNHDILKQCTQPKSIQRILLKCSGMTKFPEDFDCSDLAFLKLMDGAEFPEDFYKRMKKLEVISYEGIQCPLLPESTNLRTLCLHGCNFAFDWSTITNLVHLEVLSFAGSGITELPSAVRKLKKLKLLDLTGCSADLCIADGVLLGLVSLEELYIKASGHQAISFTKNVFEELKVISEKLSALQVEFFHKEDLRENMSFPKLERFKISIGCLLEEDKDIYSFKNTLKLVTSSSELLGSKVNKLFDKTEKLYLQVKDMEDLMDITVPSSQPCFSRLTELEVSECEDLKFLFSADVARAFMKLEHLKVSSCNILETLIRDESGDQESMIMFPKLKFLSLKELPQLSSLCDTKNRVELQQLVELILEGLPNVTSIYPEDGKQSFFNPQVAIPNLEKLKISSMEKLEQIWPSQISTGNEEMVSNNSTVRVVKVKGCDSLINLFPTNPMPLFNKLEKLQVKECGSIDVLFNIDLGPPSDGGLAVQRSNPGPMLGPPCDSGLTVQRSNHGPVLGPPCDSGLAVQRSNPGPVSLGCGCWPWDRSVEDPLVLITPLEEYIDLGCVGKFEKVSCSLRSIRVEKLGKLKVLWRINGANNSPLLSCFQSVENIHIHGCKRFSNISTPITANFDMRAHVDVMIKDSRDLVFNKALKSLDPDSKTIKIALCGVGNVGKTTLMEDLVESAKDLRMFDSVVKLVIGQEIDLFVLQETTAKCIGEDLKENAIEERAGRLCRIFTQKSQGVKSKILVILDGLRQEMDLKVIGLLDPLPNGVKLLITSRDENVCSKMGVEKSSIFRVPLFGGPEAKVLFYQTLRPSDGDAAAKELDKIAEDVVKICCGMPFLIKEIAGVLENQKRSTWKDAYSNLKQNHLNSIYQKWYEKLETEDAKAVLLLSGFFKEKAHIPVEDIVRYGWGLKLFSNEVDTLAKARQRITNSVDVLIRANMLIRSDHAGCIKMPHPLRGFVFSNLTKVKQALIEDNNMPKDAEEPYERFLLNCRGMSALPVDFNYENVRLLKLMGKGKLLKFPDNFYGRMKNLEVVAYERMNDPLLPRYSTNLRTLCLNSCSLMGDFPFLGDLTNLEILSFARCSIQKLPSTIGKLKRLKVLDVTGCSELLIDDAVFGDLDKLEELYLRYCGSRKGVCFTATNSDELKIRSLQLSTLEVELYEIMLQAKDLSFEKLKKFKISMGCRMTEYENKHYLGNILKLASNCSEVVECRMNELFEKTDRLYLRVKDMKNLEDVSMGYNSFSNLKELEVSGCADLMFLFTVPVASGFTELESLIVYSCPFLKTLIHGESRGGGGGGDGSVIKFPKLKYLYLEDLSSLVSLCDSDNIRVELYQLVKLELDRLPNISSIFADDAMEYSFFNQRVQIPNIEILRIWSMKKLVQIWAAASCEIITATGSGSEKEEVINNNNIFTCMLREIRVEQCDSLENLFPRNPLPLLNHLEKLHVEHCCSIQVLFNIDLSAGNINEHMTSSLREIQVVGLENVREIWRIKEAGSNNNSSSSSALFVMRCFQAIEEIKINECPRFRDVFAPKSISNFDIRARIQIDEVIINELTDN